MKKLIILSLIGIGVYLLWTRKAQAEEVSEIPAEIPSTPQAPDNPAINMVDQIVTEIETVIPPPSVPEKICREVIFTIPAYEVVSMSLIGRTLEKTRAKTICGTQDEIVAKAEQMKEEIAKEINKGDGVFRPRQSITSEMITYKIID